MIQELLSIYKNLQDLKASKFDVPGFQRLDSFQEEVQLMNKRIEDLVGRICEAKINNKEDLDSIKNILAPEHYDQVVKAKINDTESGVYDLSRRVPQNHIENNIKEVRELSYLSVLQTEDLLNEIREILADSKAPLMAKDIKRIVNERLPYACSRKLINQALFGPLRKEVVKDNFSYSLKEKANVESHSNVNQERVVKDRILEDVLGEIQNSDVIHDLVKAAKDNYIRVKSGSTRFDNIVRDIVRDNNVTKVEERFLEEKAKELGLDKKYVDRAKQSLNENNPYFDNLIHLVFEDGLITDEEIAYISEKVSEHGFSKKLFNIRFWQIGIIHYLDSLIHNQNFLDVIKLWAIKSHNKSLSDELKDEFFFECVSIFRSSSFEEILDNGKSEIFAAIQSKMNLSFEEISHAIREIIFKDVESYTLKVSEEVNNKTDLSIEIIKIIKEEKARIASPDSDLMAENIIFRLESLI